MAGLKTFLPTEGDDAGKLFDGDGFAAENEIFITDEASREAIAGARVPVDIGTRPNANDGDPLRTSFSKLNNFLLASYQNDSDLQDRVGSLEAGAVFLGMFRADQLPRRQLPLRAPAELPWTAADRWPDVTTGDFFSQLRPDAVPDLETDADAVDVYAQISRPITDSRPSLSVVIDNIRDETAAGTLNVRIIFPSMITDEVIPSAATTLLAPIPLDDLTTPDSDKIAFPTIFVPVVIGGMIDTAQEITEAIRDRIIEVIAMNDNGVEYFTFNIEAPTENTRRLTLDFNVRAASGATVSIPPVLAQITTLSPDIANFNAALTITSNGNTRGEGILALPWIDQDIQGTIPAYTVFQWTRDGWSVADQGRGDINAEYLFFGDERTVAERVLVRTSDDATMLNDDIVIPSTKALSEDATRDAIVEVQQFGIDYVHTVTLDAGSY